MTTAPTRSIVIEREMPYPPEKIWRALTDASLMKEWLMDNDFQPVVGRKFNFRVAPMPQWNGVTECEVLVVEPNKRLSYTWNPFSELKTIVAWTLTPTKTGTLVRMEQSGFRADQEPAYKGANYGWQKFIGGLEKVLANLG